MKSSLKAIMRGCAVGLAAVVIAVAASGCVRANYMMFEDGDFDGMEFSDYDQLQNAEIDIDDLDR